MEKIEQLSAEEISNFVRKNKDYYVKKLNNIGKVVVRKYVIFHSGFYN